MVTVKETEYETFYTVSKPTGEDNLACSSVLPKNRKQGDAITQLDKKDPLTQIFYSEQTQNAKQARGWLWTKEGRKLIPIFAADKI